MSVWCFSCGKRTLLDAEPAFHLFFENAVPDHPYRDLYAGETAAQQLTAGQGGIHVGGAKAAGALIDKAGTHLDGLRRFDEEHDVAVGA